MKFTMKHFPFLFLLAFLFSCEMSISDKTSSTTNYSDLIQKATSKNTINELDSAYYYFNQAKLACEVDKKTKNICSFRNG